MAPSGPTTVQGALQYHSSGSVPLRTVRSTLIRFVSLKLAPLSLETATWQSAVRVPLGELVSMGSEYRRQPITTAPLLFGLTATNGNADANCGLFWLMSFSSTPSAAPASGGV